MTHLFSLKIFDTDDSVLDSLQLPERPWKLVRDLTRVYTPQSIAPWLVEIPPIKEGAAFAVWKTVAKEKLAFCLPSEIRQDGDGDKVVFRGGRRFGQITSKANDSSRPGITKNPIYRGGHPHDVPPKITVPGTG